MIHRYVKNSVIIKKKVGTGIMFSAGIIHWAELGEKDWKT